MEINRVVLIGNGFDLALGLNTGYKDFINTSWKNFGEKLYERSENRKGYCNGLFDLRTYNENYNWRSPIPNTQKEIKSYIDKAPQGSNIKINKLFDKLSENAERKTWGGIEYDYYQQLLNIINNNNIGEKAMAIQDLNTDLEGIKSELCVYLSNEQTKDKNAAIIRDIKKELVHSANIEDLGSESQKHLLEDKNISVPKGFNIYKDKKTICNLFNTGELGNEPIKTGYTLIINFNYTNTAKIFESDIDKCVLINIHGELDNSNNPIIFGYGDEMDENYKILESCNINDALENVKSVNYLITDNYKQILNFIESDKYQVYIFGHSCSNSDRTLLNKIFEHDNCISIKPYFHQWHIKSTNQIKDNYMELAINITRCFEDKNKLRDRVVNKKACMLFSSSEIENESEIDSDDKNKDWSLETA